MVKRVTWFIGGAVAGAVGADAAKRKIRRVASNTAAKLAPKNVARGTAERMKSAARRSAAAIRSKERQLVARAQGLATSLDDEIDDVATVIVDGKSVEPGKVILLRQREPRSRGLRRRGA